MLNGGGCGWLSCRNLDHQAWAHRAETSCGQSVGGRHHPAGHSCASTRRQFRRLSVGAAMDHLPVVEGGRMRSLEVPYLATGRWAYDRQGVHGFPERMGIDVASLRRGQVPGCSLADCLAFVQSWLFFGLAIDVFGVVGFELRPSDFLRATSDGDGDGTQVITSELFPRLVIAWELMERGALQAGKQKRLQQIDGIIALALDFVNHTAIADWTDDEIDGPSTAALGSLASRMSTGVKIELSILWLGETLTHARQIPYFDHNLPSTMDLFSDRRPRLHGETLPKWKCHTALNQLLLDSGWCPFEVDFRHTYGDNSTNWYFANFSRHQDSEDHHGCTAAACLLNSLSKEEYRTRHVSEHCTCPFLRFPSTSEAVSNSASPDPLSDIINRRHIPLALVTGSEGEEELKIVSSQRKGILARIHHGHRKRSRTKSAQWPLYDHDAKPVIPYVAISHVWRGGLGNPHLNALPRCQLARIQGLVNAQYPPHLRPIPFWMDTLCVPLDDRRKTAIQQMKSIYQEASTVLVLDTALQSHALANNALVNLTRIRYCSWSQRLWTYQEGILAFRLVFQFQDQTIIGEDLIHQQEKDSCRFYRDNISQIRCMIQERTSLVIILDVLLGQFDLTSAKVDHPWIGRGTALPKQVDSVNSSSRRSFKQLRIAHSEYTGTFIRKDRDFQALAAFSVPLQWRRTTKMKDEALVLANLMRLDLKPLLDARSELTLKHIFQHMDFAPLNVLFIAREHFNEQGCHWMPKSLIDGRGSTALSREGGKITPRGLVVKLPGIILTEYDIAATNESTFVHIQETWYSVRTLFVQPENASDQQTPSMSRCALVYKKTNLHTPFNGAILRNIQDRSRMLVATWSGCVVISPMSSGSTLPDHATRLHVHVLPQTQTWCVD